MPGHDAAVFDWDDERELVREHRHASGGSEDGRDLRSRYERDRDRIVHSVAFRRLQGKTQIFASDWADFGRTRLTHTLEVAQIGQAIAKRLGVPEALVAAACLAHDIGHPPFGHVGEKALAASMRPYGGFDANAQTLRVVTELEEKNASYGGLDLTRATRLALVKYPYRRRRPPPEEPDPERDLRGVVVRAGPEEAFLYDEQVDAVNALMAGTGVSVADRPSDPAQPPPRTIACQIMDWADDIAYSVHDVEDGLASGLLDLDRLLQDERALREIAALLQRPHNRWSDGPPTDQTVYGQLKSLRNDIDVAIAPRPGESEADWERRFRPQGALKEVTRSWIAASVFATGLEPYDDVRSPFDFVLQADEDTRVRVEVLKAVVVHMVLKNERMTRYLYKGQRMLQVLFETLMSDPVVIDQSHHQLLPAPVRQMLSRAASEGEQARIVCDYLASLTEGQVTRLYSTLFESDGGSPI